MGISNEGAACLTAIAAIIKYIRMESELKHIQTHRQAMDAVQIVFPQIYDQLSSSDIASAINKGINVAKENYDAYSSNFRGYLKKLEIWNMEGEILGDLAFGLLLYKRFCDEYEPINIATKYGEDIQSTLINQFDISQNILDNTENVVENVFNKFKEELLNKHPID